MEPDLHYEPVERDKRTNGEYMTVDNMAALADEKDLVCLRFVLMEALAHTEGSTQRH